MKNTIVEKHFNKIANDYDYYKKKNSFYYENLKKLLKSLISKNSNVLEFGCGTGDILASLNPKKGVGYDISSEMINLAKEKHMDNKNLLFTHDSSFMIYHSYDYIFLSDVIEHLEDPAKIFKNLSGLMDSKSKLIITMANPIWEPFLMIAEKLRLKMPEGPHRRITNHELRIMLEKSGMKIIKHDYKLLVPVKIPLVTDFANKYLEKIFKPFCFLEYFVITK